MRILITGAGGSLGAGLAEVLEDRHELVLSDCFEIDTPHEFRRADLRRLDTGARHRRLGYMGGKL